MEFYIINRDAILNGNKVDPNMRLFWMQNSKDQEELSTALRKLGKPLTADRIEQNYVYSFSNKIVSDLREKGKLAETKGTTKPADIEHAQGLKVYDENQRKMYTYDAMPLAIFNIIKNDTTIVGKATQSKNPPEPQTQKPSEAKPTEQAKSSSGGFWSWFSSCYKPSDD